MFHLSSAEEVNKVPRYSVTVVDHYDEAVIAQGALAVFVIPLGSERHMQLDLESKRRELVTQANMARLIIVQLGRG